MKLSEYKLLKKYIELLNREYPLNITYSEKHFFEKNIYDSLDFKYFILQNEFNIMKNEVLKILKTDKVLSFFNKLFGIIK